MDLSTERKIRFEEREKLLNQVFHLLDNMRAIAAICHDQEQMVTVTTIKEYIKQIKNSYI